MKKSKKNLQFKNTVLRFSYRRKMVEKMYLLLDKRTTPSIISKQASKQF